MILSKELLINNDYNTVLSSDFNSASATSVNFNNNSLNGMLYVNEKTYAVTDYGNVYASNDGVTYSLIFGQPSQYSQSSCICQDFTQQNGTVIAFRGAWEEAINCHIGTTNFYINQLYGCRPKQCIYYGNKYYLVGAAPDNKGFISISNDLYNWTDPILLDGQIYTIAYGNGMFLVGGDNLYSSTDGVNYQLISYQVMQPYISNFTKIIFENGYFFAISSSSVYKSKNGINWVQLYNGSYSTDNRFTDIAYGNNKLVAFSGKTIVSSIDLTTNKVVRQAGNYFLYSNAFVCYGNNKFYFLYDKNSSYYSNNMDWGVE